jgi:hypothetical protein
MKSYAEALVQVRYLRDTVAARYQEHTDTAPPRDPEGLSDWHAREGLLSEQLRKLEWMLEDGTTLREWLDSVELQALDIWEGEDDDGSLFALLVLEFSPIDRVLDLAGWQAGSPWPTGEDDQEPWGEPEAAAVRRRMAAAMISHAHLLGEK